MENYPVTKVKNSGDSGGIYTFIYKLMWSKMQQLCDWMTKRKKIKRDFFFIHGYLLSNDCNFECGVDAQSSDRDVNGFTGKRFSLKLHMCVSTSEFICDCSD